MANTALNRSGVVLLTNKSGGALTQGAVVVVDTANASAFTTTTTGGYTNTFIGVIIEPNGIANNASGLVALSGYVPKINLNTAATIGQLIKTHTVAGQGTPHDAPSAAGDFAEALTASATPEAIVFGKPSGAAGGGGAPTTAKYVVSEADATLSAELIIPRFAGNADIPPTSPDAKDDEFNAGSLDVKWTWLNQVAGATAFSGSFLNMSYGSLVGSDQGRGIYQAAPSTPWSATLGRLGLITGSSGTDCVAGILLMDSVSGRLAIFGLALPGGTHQSRLYMVRMTNTTTWSAYVAVSNMTSYPLYLRVTDDNTDLKLYASGDSAQFPLLCYTESRTAFLTNGPDRIGIGFYHFNTNINLTADWFRIT